MGQPDLTHNPIGPNSFLTCLKWPILTRDPFDPTRPACTFCHVYLGYPSILVSPSIIPPVFLPERTSMRVVFPAPLTPISAVRIPGLNAPVISQSSWSFFLLKPISLISCAEEMWLTSNFFLVYKFNNHMWILVVLDYRRGVNKVLQIFKCYCRRFQW